MNKTKVTLYLVTAGLTMLVIGLYIALAPNYYLATMTANIAAHSGDYASTTFGNSTDMLSDIRGMGGMLLFTGIFTIMGVFQTHYRTSALIASTLVFSAYAALRTVSVMLDGIPSSGILLAYIIEVGFSLWGIALIRIQQRAAGIEARHTRKECHACAE